MCHWIITNLPPPSSFPPPSDSEVEWKIQKEEGGEKREDVEKEEDYDDEEDEDVTIMPYLAPAPPKRTGRHRYVFVLLSKEVEEGGGVIKKPERREHWGYGKEGRGVREWAVDNRMNIIGEFVR